MNINQLKLYLVTDSSLLDGRSMIDVVMDAVKGGVSIVQLREKDCDTYTFVKLAMELKQALSLAGVPLIINDRIDVALAVNADGVHIGQKDMPYCMAKRLLGPNKIIGLSIETFEELDKANRLDVDYVAASPVFATPTKTDTSTPWGIDGLREFCKRSLHPVVAIGGINKDNIQNIRTAGAQGAAVVSAILKPKNTVTAARELLEHWP